VISVGHCHSQLLIELLQLEGCISLPLLEGIDSRHAADLELSHLFLDVLVVPAQELLLLFKTLVFSCHSNQIYLKQGVLLGELDQPSGVGLTLVKGISKLLKLLNLYLFLR